MHESFVVCWNNKKMLRLYRYTVYLTLYKELGDNLLKFLHWYKQSHTWDFWYIYHFTWVCVYVYIYIYIYSSQHLKLIKKVHQGCPETRTHFRTTFLCSNVLILFKCWLYILYIAYCTYTHCIYTLLLIQYRYRHSIDMKQMTLKLVLVYNGQGSVSHYRVFSPLSECLILHRLRGERSTNQLHGDYICFIVRYISPSRVVSSWVAR